MGEGQTKATVYTLDYAKKSQDPAARPGIVLGKDGIYDIIIDAPQLTRKNVIGALKELTKQTGIEYKL